MNPADELVVAATRLREWAAEGGRPDWYVCWDTAEGCYFLVGPLPETIGYPDDPIDTHHVGRLDAYMSTNLAGWLQQLNGEPDPFPSYGLRLARGVNTA